MDGDRPVVDRRDIFESRLQELVWEAFCEGWTFGNDDLPDPDGCGYAETGEASKRYNKRIHELLISYFDSQTSDVGSQDEASEKGAMGDGVRSERCLIPRDPCALIWDEFINDLKRAHVDPNNVIGHCKLTKKSDGSISARIEYVQQNPR